MILVLFFTVIVIAVQSEDVPCIKYSFTDYFYQTFGTKGCEDPHSWIVINYESDNVTKPHEESLTGLKTTGKSCASSFPIVFYSDSALKVKMLAKNCSVSIEVYEDEVKAESMNFTNEDSNIGWSTIALEIKKGAYEGYIKFSGYCYDEGFLIIDSFQYLPQGVQNECNLVLDYDPNKEFQEGEYILLKNIENFTSDTNKDYEIESDITEGSGGYEEIETEEEIYTEDPATIWNPLTIFLVALGGFIGLGALSYGAFQLGKVRGGVAGFRDVENMESPRTLTVPRVRSIYGGNTNIRMY